MARAGSRALSIFGNALNVPILHAHTEGPMRPGELEEAIGWASPSSLRVAVGKMCDVGVLAKVELDADTAWSTATEMTTAGQELLGVAGALERWLQEAPDGPIALDDPAAHGIVKVLTAGWETTMVRALAEGPLTLSELSAAIRGVSYPGLKRRLAKLRATHLVSPVGSDKTPAYEATEWLRRSIAPLAIAGRWELLHDTGVEPISPVEVEAAFLLTLPLVELPKRLSGDCTLAVMLTDDDQAEAKPEVAGVAVTVEQGQLISCTAKGVSSPTTWALGTAAAWLKAVIDGSDETLRVSGATPRLPQSLVEGIHNTIFNS